ncbi:MAG: hypothetical protein ABGZ17_19315, partial [Planctomycetaceae bacterium]
MIRCGDVALFSIAIFGLSSVLEAQVPGVMGGEFTYMNGGMPGGCSDQLYPFDNPAPWLHGQFQAIPAYGGHVSFRPYNYKHIGPQSRMAAMMGAPATMPYSQQFWHRYAESARMERVSADPGRSPLSTRLTQVVDRRVLHAAARLQPQSPRQSAAVWPHKLAISHQNTPRFASTPLEQRGALSVLSREAEIQGLQ